jgi:hypothetical protein
MVCRALKRAESDSAPRKLRLPGQFRNGLKNAGYGHPEIRCGDLGFLWQETQWLAGLHGNVLP